MPFGIDNVCWAKFASVLLANCKHANVVDEDLV